MEMRNLVRNREESRSGGVRRQAEQVTTDDLINQNKNVEYYIQMKNSDRKFRCHLKEQVTIDDHINQNKMLNIIFK